MRIAVVGAGAMGSIFGAGFTEGGHETVLIDVVEDVVERLNRDGVRIDRQGVERVVPVNASSDPESIGRVDVVVFFTKCYHTAEAADFARPLVDGSTVVVSLQNGWGNGDTLAERYPAGPNRGRCHLPLGHGQCPGARTSHRVGPTVIGPYEGMDLVTSEPVAAAVRSAAFEVQLLQRFALRSGRSSS